jgi:hypothetical protein
LPDLLVIVPSRGRPASIARLWDAMAATCEGDTELLAGCDADDPTLGEYPEGPEYEVNGGLRGVVAHLNALSAQRTGHYRAMGALGDDFVPRTPGWDVAVMEALEKTPFAYGDERFPGRAPGESVCHIFTRSAVVDALGYLGPPCFRHMFVDNAWAAWGKACGTTFLDGVVIEHLHPAAGKAPGDETYQRSAVFLGPDRQAWEAYQASGLAADIAKIKAVA